jgi:hypothetical protein
MRIALTSVLVGNGERVVLAWQEVRESEKLMRRRKKGRHSH